jgi:hypothetical protein
MNELLTFNDWLPVIFLAVMGLAMLAWASCCAARIRPIKT